VARGVAAVRAELQRRAHACMQFGDAAAFWRDDGAALFWHILFFLSPIWQRGLLI
jgi:hypothetical protein